jgi:hypothetical protein
MKQQKLSAMFQPLPLAKPPPRNVPEDEEDDSDDDDDEDWDVPLSSLGKRPSTSSQSCNNNNTKPKPRPSPSTKLLSKKNRENRENIKTKQKKKSSSSLSGILFVSALTAQKQLGEKRKLEQPPQQAASTKIGKQSKATVPPTPTLESELPDSVDDENAKPTTMSQDKSNLNKTGADQQNSQVGKEQEAQTTGTASNDNEQVKAQHAVSPTLCSLDGEHSEAMPKVDSTTKSDNQETPPEDSTKPTKSFRRRISSSDVDYYHDPDDASLEKKQRPLSLISQLIQRTTHGTRFPHPRTIRKWKIPSWIRLDHPPTKIDHMAWDTMGVLLAVASENMIRIYDWDMVGAADNKGRNQRTRNKADPKNPREEWMIPPVLTFRVPQPVASLAWNPKDMDQLAVGLRYVC